MLVELHREIDSRTREIAVSHGVSHGGWPCRKGCDQCCRRLAELPHLTRAEWDLVEEGLRLLTPEVRNEIRGRLARVTSGGAPYTCPFLNSAAGACLIYEHRPVACRTYGFYVERDRGLYCGEIEARVNSGEMADVVWGNVVGVEAKLAEFGEKLGMFEWFSGWLRSSPELLPTPPSESPDPCGGPSAVPTSPPSAPR